MYKILIKAEPKIVKKPKNPVVGYFEDNFDGWFFHKECGKTFMTEEKVIAIDKYEQLLYSIPAKNLKLIEEIDTLVKIDPDRHHHDHHEHDKHHHKHPEHKDCKCDCCECEKDEEGKCVCKDAETGEMVECKCDCKCHCVEKQPVEVSPQLVPARHHEPHALRVKVIN